MSGPTTEEYIPKKKIQKKLTKTFQQPQMNSSVLQPDMKQAIQSHFSNKNDYQLNGVISLTNEPFTCCVLQNFINDEVYLELLRDELLDLEFHQKRNDLYEFHQSNDLGNVKTPYIAALKVLLYEDCKKWLKDILDIEFTDTVDATCSKYFSTDVLLCHDDELEGRRVAFILYLVPPSWSKEDGGTLDLFSVDENGQPKKVIKSLLPVWNTLVFFEVSPVSFHQVSEILNEEKCRLSISGWFHGPCFTRAPPFIEIPQSVKTAGHIMEKQLREWINPIYLQEDVQIQIREKFQSDSEIELCDFLQEAKYELLSNELQSDVFKWNYKGPYNKRHYEILDDGSYTTLVNEYLDVMQSEAIFLILSNLTGLKLHKLAAIDSDEDSMDDEQECKTTGTDEKKCRATSTDEKECRATSKVQIRQWKHQCYTLIHDEAEESAEYALDAAMFLNCSDWKAEYGGWISYIAKGEDEELLTVVPVPNSLALIYRDKETLKFVKYINHRIMERPITRRSFQDIYIVYYE